jgi:hypothetical protein
MIRSSPTTFDITQLNPFSPPFPIGKQQECGCYIDVDGVPHLASWTGEWAVSDFSDTSRLSNFQLFPLELSPEITSLWRSSKLLGFGTDACIRSEGTDSYPTDWSTNKAFTNPLPALFVQTNKALDILFDHVIK